jgi:flavin reductase (DIM6/NTAB) family NADH-FMN oxidoreductase RutF
MGLTARPLSALEVDRVKRWMGNDLDYPMLIVTTADEREHAGCLVGFACQCSIEPLRYVVFLSKNNHTYRVARKTEAVAVHAVPRDRPDLAELFGGETGDERDKLAECEWREGPHGVPIIDGCSKWFVGTPLERFDVGDHVGFLLAPIEGDSSEGSDLGFQAARSITPGHEA